MTIFPSQVPHERDDEEGKEGDVSRAYTAVGADDMPAVGWLPATDDGAKDVMPVGTH